jgi:hypothetical protein
MSTASVQSRSLTKRLLWAVLIGIFITVPLLVYAFFVNGGRFSIDEPEPIAGPPQPQDPRGRNSPFVIPGIRKPDLVQASKSNLKDDDEVIGIAVDGKHRAYLVSAMSLMQSHVVNDMIGQTPVTVTYCDRNDCAAVFTADELGKPLDVWTMGYLDGLLLRINSDPFFQSTGKFSNPGKEHQRALPSLPFERMKWKDWVALHPDSEVFVGTKARPPEVSRPQK